MHDEGTTAGPHPLPHDALLPRDSPATPAARAALLAAVGQLLAAHDAAGPGAAATAIAAALRGLLPVLPSTVDATETVALGLSVHLAWPGGATTHPLETVLQLILAGQAVSWWGGEELDAVGLAALEAGRPGTLPWQDPADGTTVR